MMSTYKDSWFDVTVECDRCHDMFDCEIQLFSVRDLVLVKDLVNNLITRCHNCGADGQELFITVSNEYFSVDEIRQLRDRDKKWIFLFRRRNEPEAHRGAF